MNGAEVPCSSNSCGANQSFCLRLVLHKLPEPEMAASGWLALGPIGMGALALVLLGGDAPAVFAIAGLSYVGKVALGFGIIGGTMLWGYGVW
jgi:tellurite resistance protein TehA-like permease